MEILTADLVLNLRRETLDGREYLVTPVTLIVPGVLNGSQGPLYYPVEEIQKNPGIWNGVPLLLEHPKGGSPARGNPSVVVAQGLGILRNVKANGKLTGEAWHDVEALKTKAPAVLSSLEAGQKVEVSTGLGTENENVEGEFNGTPYKAIARNYQPDHLAVLPNTKGACSVADGCGLNVNEKGQGLGWIVKTTFERDVENAATKSEGGRPFPARDYAYVPDRNKPSTWKLRLTNVPGGSPDARIVGQAVAALGRGFRGNKEEIPPEALPAVKAKVRRAWLEANPGKKPEDVPRVIRNKRGFTMAKELTKEQIVNGLIENGCCWDEEDREGLSGLSDEKLKKLHGDLVANQEQKELVTNATKEFTDGVGNKHTWNGTSWDSKVVEKKTEGVQFSRNTVVGASGDDTAVQNALSEEDQKTLEWARKQQQAMREDAEGKILANESNKLTKEQLSAMDLETVQNLAASIPEKEEEKEPTFNALGMSIGTTTLANNEKVEPMMPIEAIQAGAKLGK
jgi:hypothetical protein